MDIVLSQNTDKPIYSQIYEQISSQILKGEVPPETKLPPIRTVALNLRISVIPVKQAWEQLEREGFISTAAGRGTYVKELAHHEINNKRISIGENLLKQGVQACKDMGLQLEEILDIVKKNF